MRLFEDGKIGRLSIRNRIVMAPMSLGGLQAADSRFSQRCIDYFEARARGGVGMIIAGVGIKHIVTGDRLGPEDPVDEAYLNRLVDALHKHGTKFCAQLSIGGGRIVPVPLPLGPSVLPCWFDPKVMTKEVTETEIEQLQESLRMAARKIAATRVDAIELHCHGGYLVDEFMTALWNKRTDKYGGNLDNRLRIVFDMIRVIKEETGPDFPLIVRYGLTHCMQGGRDIDEGLEIARKLEKAGVAAIDLDVGCYETHYWFIPSKYQPPACSVNLLEKAKKAVKIPVMVVGKLGYPEQAEQTLQEHKADFIVLGRSLLADPEWANKVKDGKSGDIRPCIGCHEGCHVRIREGKYLSCAVNPETGMERDFALQPAARKKSVVVIGGGPGGMEAAIVSAIRGHKVTLFDKGNALGGNLIQAAVPDFKRDYRRLIDYLTSQLKQLGVTVELGKEVNQDLIKSIHPEVVFIATGSTAIIPAIPGAENMKTFTAGDILIDKEKAGDTVVIIGGGLVGCETALYLAQKGKKVTIIEKLDDIARDLWSASRQHLLLLLAENHVKVFAGSNVLHISDKNVVFTDNTGKKNDLQADTVVLAVGYRANKDLLEKIKAVVPETYTVGDCVEPRKVMSAIWEGFHAARQI
jgi:2-enoate reductase